MKIAFISILFLSFTLISQQNLNQQKKVLFLGNSYTSVNNLPEMTRVLALSASDTLIYDSNTPGGHTLEGHFGNVTSTGKIAQGTWDFVVLQEQSQRPSFPDEQVEVEVFPFARKLDSLINISNPCTETMFYMTWGRKNGDAQNCVFFPPLCTYNGMDSLLNLRYVKMAENNQAILSPVGALWHYLRDNFPDLELYSADESHPSLLGSYAAACSFYSTIFRENPLNITNDYGLSSDDALIIRNSTKLVVFDSLFKWNIGKYDPLANFSFTSDENQNVSFINSSEYSSEYFWNFDDGNVSIETNPIHQYAQVGTYNVMLISSKCGLIDTIYKTITIDSTIIGFETIVSACDNYIWETTGVNYTLSGIYTDTLLSSSNIDSVVTLNLSIFQSPTVSLSGLNDVCDTLAPFLLTLGLPVGGNYSGQSIINNQFDPSIGAGNYSYTYNYVDVNNCSAEAQNTIKVIECSTSAKLDESELNTFVFYPNPVESILVVKSEHSTFENAKFCDLNGKVVHEFQLVNGENLIDLSKLENGIYFLEIGHKKQKICKE